MFFSLSVALASPLPPDVDAPLRTGAQAPHDAAVVIGIEDYAFLPDVPSAARDSRAVYNWLVYTRGIPPEQVVLLQGGNREQILEAVERARSLRKADGTLWVSYAGHGAASPEDGGPLLVGDDAKAEPSVFQARSIPVSELGRDAVLLLDTCWAGRGRNGAELLPGTRFAVPTFAQPPTTGAMVTAAMPTQLSEPYAPADHGLFTYFFVGAVRGWADGELDGAPDGQVTLREAHAFTGRAIAAIRPNGQQPTLLGEDRVLVDAPGRLEPAPDLASLPPFAGLPAAPAPLLGPVPRPVPVADPPLLPGGKSWKGQLRLGGDGVLVSEDGKRISVLDAAQATMHHPPVASGVAKYQGAAVRQYSGATMIGSGAALGLLSLASFTGALGTSETAPYIAAGAGVSALLGGAQLVIGTSQRRRARSALVEAINDAP